MSRTNIELDDALVLKARKLTRLKTKREIVDRALELLVRSESRKGILRFYGSGVCSELLPSLACRARWSQFPAARRAVSLFLSFLQFLPQLLCPWRSGPALRSVCPAHDR